MLVACTTLYINYILIVHGLFNFIRFSSAANIQSNFEH